MHENLKIQLAKHKDINKVVNCISKALYGGGPLLAWLSEKDRIEWHIEAKECYVIKNNNRIIGAMCLELLDTFEVESLGISKQYRNKGYGRKFIQKALDLAKKYGYNKVTLGSCKDLNSHGFYKKMGFKVEKDEHGDFECEYKIKKGRKK